MISLENVRISGGRRLWGTHVFRGWHIKNSTFRLASLGYNRSLTGDAVDLIADSLVENCVLERCGIGVAEVSSTTLKDIRGDLLICWGTLFDRVKIVGRFDKAMLHGIPSTRASSRQLEKHAERRKKFYADVSWALDISEALFDDFSIRTDAIPLEKVVIDPESQFVLHRGRFESVPISSLGVSAYTKAVIQAMLDENANSTLLVAPKLDAKLFDTVQLDVQRLRELGLLLFSGS
jgi:hypothetical protein